MRVLLAPDKFKGSLTAMQVAEAMAAGLRRMDPNIELDLCPMADGGEGTVNALVAATGGRFETARVTGPLPEMKVEARFGFLGDGKTAVVELAAASGLALLKLEERNPLATTTFGTGELLMAAMKRGAETIILGIGGSATIDGGVGIAQACGLPVILEGGEPLSPTEPLTGGDIDRVVLIKHGRGSAIEKIKIVVACDVTNPLLGPQGAAAVFGPQKGAGAEDIPRFESSLLELARRNNKLAIVDLPGSGAAGGVGFGMAAFFGASLRNGAPMVMDSVDFSRRLRGVQACFTGEGRLDSQTISGKSAAAVADACRRANVPCYALAGEIEDTGQLKPLHLAGAIALIDGARDRHDSLTNAEALIAAAAEKIWRKLYSNGGG
jgi:glycerate kinase